MNLKTNSPALSRLVLRALLLGALLLGSVATSFAHEVLVYSYFTAAGRAVASPTHDRPARCVLGTDVAPVWGARDEMAVDPEFVNRMLRRALGENGFVVGDAGAAVPDEVLVYHWGIARPLVLERGTGEEEFLNRGEMLALLAGRARDGLSPSERTALEAAAREERHVLFVSAYDARALREQGRHTLLWRTHLSVPSQHLAKTQALPVLLAAGAGLFGRDTRGARVISIGASRALLAVW